MSWLLLSAVVVCSAIATGFRPGQTDAASPTPIRICGSDSYIHLVRQWLTAFSLKSEEFVYELDPTGSSEGVEALVAGLTDIALTSRSLKPNEVELVRQSGVEVRETMVAQTGIGVVVHPSNTVASMSLDQLGDVFTGVIRNWRELGGPDKPIVVIQKTTGSSPRLFRERVLGERDFITDSVIVDSKEAVIVEVGRRPWSIGFTGLGEIISNLGTVQLMLLNRNDPDEGSTYALRRPFFFYTVEGNTDVQPFIDFVLSSEGQALIVHPGYFPAG